LSLLRRLDSSAADGGRAACACVARTECHDLRAASRAGARRAAAAKIGGRGPRAAPERGLLEDRRRCDRQGGGRRPARPRCAPQPPCSDAPGSLPACLLSMQAWQRLRCLPFAGPHVFARSLSFRRSRHAVMATELSWSCACTEACRSSVGACPILQIGCQQKRWARAAAGVRASDGDGTVPLLSLGSLCARHWREPRLNPSGIRVVTREFPHEPVYGLGELRCGARAAQHVSCAPAAPGETSHRGGTSTFSSAAQAQECDVLQSSCCAQVPSCPQRKRSTHLRAPDLSALPAHQPLRRALRQPPAVPAGLLPPCAPGQRSCGAAALAARLTGLCARSPAARR